ncbi:MAG: ABC transporter substrate-binding protein, partial [Clostridiaceae bacterium]|nr:ABC transporter substrate-binding protein [Clostridiaceae bacterium]
ANILHFKSARDRDSALQSGKLDGMVCDYLAIVFANEGGYDLRFISKSDGNIKLLAGKDSGIDSVDGLKGKKIGMSLNTVMEYTADKMLEVSQVSPDDTEKIAIPQLPTRLEMLENGKIDAAILPDPLAGLAVKNGAQILASTDELANKCIAIAFSEKSIEKNTAEIKAVFRAYNNAVEYLQSADPTQYIDYVIEKQGFPAETKDSIILPEYKKAELPEENIFIDVINWLKDKNLIKENYEYKDLVNDAILR